MGTFHDDHRQRQLERLVARARAEYVEMPGLRLTPSQARRLWDLDPVTCDTILDTLVNARFLTRTAQGAFVRADTEGPSRWRATGVA